jgi:phenylalanyl-tRNA synthetase beta chain
MVPIALDRAAALILEVAGGRIAAGAIDCYPAPVVSRQLTLSARQTNEILGLQLDLSEIQRLLCGIGLDSRMDTQHDGERLLVDVPTFRPDLEREIDLIEEVARLNGYDQIPVTMPQSRSVCHAPSAHLSHLARVRNEMVASGFSEVVNYSFCSPGAWDKLGLSVEDPRRNTVRILNPLNEEQSVMRTTLVGSLLETVARNLAYRCRDLRLFELRPVFSPGPEGELPSERQHLTAVLCGRRTLEGWAQEGAEVDFYDLKGVAQILLDAFRIGQVKWQSGEGEVFLHPGKSCTLYSGDRKLGTLGEVHPAVREKFEIDQTVYLLDLDLEDLFGVIGPFPGIRPLSRFPDVYRDSAVLLDEEIPAARLLAVIDRVKPRFAEEVVLFDLYRGSGIPPGQKSLAIRVRYRSAEKTLTDDEIQSAHGRIVKSLEQELGACLR